MRALGRARTTPIRTKVVGLALVGMSPLLMPVEVAPSTPTAQPSQHPNIVVIMLDDARLDDLDYMPKTQRRLVSAGAEFTNFYAPTPLCCPARAAFLSGQYGHNNAVLSNQARYGGSPRSMISQPWPPGWIRPTPPRGSANTSTVMPIAQMTPTSHPAGTAGQRLSEAPGSTKITPSTSTER